MVLWDRIVAIFLLLLLTSEISFAQSTSVGSLPPSVSYSFKILFENIGDLFAFTARQKLERNANLLDKRIAEIEALKEVGTSSEFSIVAEEANRRLDNIKRIAFLNNASTDTFKLINNLYERHIERLTRVLEIVPARAEDAITNVILRQTEHRVDVINKLAERNETVTTPSLDFDMGTATRIPKIVVDSVKIQNARIIAKNINATKIISI